MNNQIQWIGRWFAPVLVCVVITACGASEKTPTVSTSVSVAPTAAKTSPQPGTTAQASPPTAIATLQTEARMAGFSGDGKHYMHLESWRDTGAGIPHAAMQIVNLPANACVANGCVRTRFNESQANLSTEAAENSLLEQTQALRQELKLATPVAGISLPVTARSRNADGSETVTVNLANNQPLQLKLRQKQAIAKLDGGGEKEQASMQLEITYAGKTRTVGSMTQMRDWTQKFSIQSVEQSPDGKHIAVLVTAAERAFEGTLGRTMVQGFDL